MPDDSQNDRFACIIVCFQEPFTRVLQKRQPTNATYILLQQLWEVTVCLMRISNRLGKVNHIVWK
jgi:hypothetical protein